MSACDRQGFDRIIGQELAKRVLMRAVRGQPAHAYLFQGLHGTGKLTTALEFSKALNCLEPRDGHACGQCAICHAVEHGNFPDTRVWSPKSQDTTIESMREMRELASFRPSRGNWLINIVEQADTLNEDSGNCILKLLEEPPAYVINILLYKNPANVLATIRSRCQLVRFEQVPADELAARLVEEHGLSPEEADFLAIYSQGRPGVAIGLIDDDDFRRKRENVAGVVAVAARGNAWAALALAEALRSGSGPQTAETEEEDADAPKQAKAAAGARKGVRDAVTEALDMLLVWYRDMLAIKLQGDDAPIVNTDKRGELIDLSDKFAHAGKLFNAVHAILHAKRTIQGNANPQIVTEALMMRLAS